MSSVSSQHVINLFYSVNSHILMTLCDILQMQFNLLDRKEGNLKAEIKTEQKTDAKLTVITHKRNITAVSIGQQGLFPAQQRCPLTVPWSEMTCAQGGSCQPMMMSPHSFPSSWVGFSFCAPPFSPLWIVSSRHFLFSRNRFGFFCGFNTNRGKSLNVIHTIVYCGNCEG